MLQKHRFWTHWYIKTTLLKSVCTRSFSGLYFLSFFPYSVRIREHTDRENSEYGHFYTGKTKNLHWVTIIFNANSGHLKSYLKHIPHSQALTTKTICSAQTEYIKKLWNNGIKIHRDKIQREPLKIPNGWSREYQFCAWWDS